eukprot:Gb_14391 [translate_table: standard]
MAMAHPPWMEQKKMVLLLGLLQFQGTKNTLTYKIKINTAKQAYGNVNNNSFGIETCEHVRILCEQGQLREALHILRVLDYGGIRPDSSTYVFLLRACLNMKALPEGQLVHAHITESACEADIIVGNTLVILYAKCGSLVDARRVWERMAERNVISWTVIIAAYARNGYAEEALTLFSRMQLAGIQPNKFTFASVIPACANLAVLEHGEEIHEEVIRRGFESNVFVGSAVVDMYVKCRSLENARKVFDKMPERNVVSWNAMISGYAHNGYAGEALKLFQSMPERNVISWNAIIAGCALNGHFDEALKLFQQMPEQDVVSWNAMITAYAQNGNFDQALKLFHQMPERDVVSWNAMIAAYAQTGYVEEAMTFFHKMPERNVVSWNGMISGYIQNAYFEEALQLFRQMYLTGVKPDADTFSSILPACANLATLEHGKEVHEDIIRSGFHFDAFVGSALIDMYAKCGSIENACRVFDKMPRRDVVFWTVMIVGYAMHGCGKEALQLFEEMQNSGTIPNSVTFTGVLSACCHAGLVDQGWKYFDSMSRDYHLTPAMEHYCCMIDLLGRSGLLDEAQDFINKMPVKPEAAVWVSLLGACRIHVNIELGERVAQRLFQMDPKNTAPYVLLSNIYAAAGRWDDIEKVRKMMIDRSVRKKPGRSWIEVNNKVYAFGGEDRAHPQMQKIHAELESLSGRMKDAGYVPDMRFVFHDVEEEQKEHILSHHSEKLAIAFGLISTSPGTPIRIVKNLRVCGDCHSAARFISKVVAREIILRDVSRFHHFKDGWCTCGDYW